MSTHIFRRTIEKDASADARAKICFDICSHLVFKHHQRSTLQAPRRFSLPGIIFQQLLSFLKSRSLYFTLSVNLLSRLCGSSVAFFALELPNPPSSGLVWESAQWQQIHHTTTPPSLPAQMPVSISLHVQTVWVFFFFLSLFFFFSLLFLPPPEWPSLLLFMCEWGPVMPPHRSVTADHSQTHAPSSDDDDFLSHISHHQIRSGVRAWFCRDWFCHNTLL